MELLERYETIISQGLKELGPVEVPTNHEKALQVQGVLAPVLGDILYRLCIEHGIAYTPFRETVIAMMTDKKPAMAGQGKPGSTPRPFAARFESLHGLILLAVEMIPEGD